MQEHPACPACNARESRPVVVASDDWVADGAAASLAFSVVRCAACKLCYTTPRFREAAKHLAYSGSYPFYQRARRDTGPLSDGERALFAARAGRVERVAPVPGRLLDLGMGDGVFLEVMQRRGWQTVGVDCEADVVAYAQRRLGLAACFAADIETEALPAGPFAVVTMWGVLQLMYRPQELLEKVCGILGPRGVLVIGVSNFGGAGAALFGASWRGLGLPRHLLHFEPDSLTRLAQRAGFEVLDVAFETPYWIVAQSLDAALKLPGVLGGAARRGAHAVLGLAGRTRLGDTMYLTARLASA